MSDVMLLGVLRMPPSCWDGSDLDIMQRHYRYLMAADKIEALKHVIKDLIEEIKVLHSAEDCRAEGRLECGMCRILSGLSQEDLD